MFFGATASEGMGGLGTTKAKKQPTKYPSSIAISNATTLKYAGNGRYLLPDGAAISYADALKLRKEGFPSRSTQPAPRVSTRPQVQRSGVQAGDAFKFTAYLPFQLSAITTAEDSYKQTFKSNLEHTNAFSSLDVSFSSGTFSGTVTITGMSKTERGRIEDIRDDCITAIQNAGVSINVGSANATITQRSESGGGNANVGGEKAPTLLDGLAKQAEDLAKTITSGSGLLYLVGAVALVFLIKE